MKKNAEYFFYKGVEAHQKNEFIQAKIYYEKAIELNPNDANAYYNLALLLQNDYFKEYKQAKIYYEKAIELNPKNANAYNNLAALLQNDYFKEYKQAKIYYEKAIELDPNDADTYHNLAVLLIRHFNENEKALKLLEKVRQIEKPKAKLIKESSEDIYSNEKGILPYAIKQIQIENFRGIKKTGISDIPIDTQWIFLAGNNGAGKTSIIQSISLGLWGQIDSLDKQFENSNIGIEFKQKHEIIINNLKDDTNFTKFSHFASYGPSRLSMQSASAGNEEIGESSKTYNIFNDDGMLLNIESELSRWYYMDKFKERYENIKNLLIKILNINDIKVDEKNYKKLLYQEKEENGQNNYEWLEFKNLGSGYRSLIGMIGDILLRFYKIEENENKKPKEIEGIVLIDEFDLHLHPKWQKRLVEELSSNFKKIQFIVSTHSIIPLLGAPENSFLIKVNRSLEKGIFLERINLKIKNLLPETLLTSELFDFQDITHKDLEDFSELRTERTYNEILQNDEIQEKLNQNTDNEDYPDDLFE